MKLAETRTTGSFADAIRITLEKVETVLSAAAKDVFRYPAIAIDSASYPSDGQFNFEPYLLAIRSNCRMVITVELDGKPFEDTLCPVVLQASSAEIALLVWNEKEQAFATLRLADIIQAEVLDSRFPLSRARLLQVWESSRRLK